MFEPGTYLFSFEQSLIAHLGLPIEQQVVKGYQIHIVEQW
jgi:hypothetical protein